MASAWEQEWKVLCGPVQPFLVSESQKISPLQLACHSVHRFWLYMWCCPRPDKDDEKAAREREKRRVRQEERRAEMKSRHDEIRRKYGTVLK
ncbi:hypothetical protein DV515_00015140 [Chloebia gouldiae]|uniref:Uncharacterized protein n=1 Tax=Chloebia gouldiae TaxID=44316 RepID=A0A3L8RWK6_CHLGU|nr:hypothetical protein DV515_00015140 [Chloebia gouldiae]